MHNSIKPTLSKLSQKIINEINNLVAKLFNEVFYAINESECQCGDLHTHDGYLKLSAQLNKNVLEIKMHYLLEQFTRTQLQWTIYNKFLENTIPMYISIRINLARD